MLLCSFCRKLQFLTNKKSKQPTGPPTRVPQPPPPPPSSSVAAVPPSVAVAVVELPPAAVPPPTTVLPPVAVLPVGTLPPPKAHSSPTLPSIPKKGTIFANTTPLPPGYTWRPWTGDVLPEEEEERATLAADVPLSQLCSNSPPTDLAISTTDTPSPFPAELITSIPDTPPSITRVQLPTPGSTYRQTGRPATISFTEPPDRRVTRAMLGRAIIRALLKICHCHCLLNQTAATEQPPHQEQSSTSSTSIPSIINNQLYFAIIVLCTFCTHHYLHCTLPYSFVTASHVPLSSLSY